MFSTQLYSPEGTRAYGKTGRQTRRVSATKKKNTEEDKPTVRLYREARRPYYRLITKILSLINANQ